MQDILLEPRLEVVESFFAELSPTLAVQTGPGTVGGVIIRWDKKASFSPISMSPLDKESKPI